MAASWSRNPQGHDAPPVIVVGGERTALGVLRCLHDAGIPAYVAASRGDLISRSRWFRPTPGTPWDGTLDAGALQALDAMPLERAVLIPCADDATLWAANLPPALAARFKSSLATIATLEVLQDKSRFGAFLASHGIAHPRTFPIANADDIAAIPLDALDRVFLKPTDSQRFSAAFGVKGLWASGRDELLQKWHRVDACGFEVVAQEYVPGGADDHYFVDGFRDRDGRFTGLFARRRLRIFPPDFGNSSYCVSIPLEQVAQAVESTLRLLGLLDYRGIFSAEFKRDQRDGSFRILEVNSRAWWYVGFAARCGVNVCEMAYHDALGEPVPSTTRYRSGEGCVNLASDVLSIVRSKQARPPLATLLRQWGGAHFHLFRIEDPMPALIEHSIDAWHALRRLFRRRDKAS